MSAPPVSAGTSQANVTELCKVSVALKFLTALTSLGVEAVVKSKLVHSLFKPSVFTART